MGIENGFLKPCQASLESAESSTNKKVEDFIGEISEKSRYKRDSMLGGKEQIRSVEGESSVIDRITEKDDQRIKKLSESMGVFAPEEADPPEIIESAIANVDGIYAYYILETPNGEIKAYVNSNYLELPLKPGEAKSKEVISFVGFAVVDEDFKRKGLGKEIVQSALKATLEKAKNQGQEIKAFIGEATETSEAFWNSVGQKRLYYEDSEGNYREVPYVCPPINWDYETGKPKDPETGEVRDESFIKEYSVSKHLMLKSFGDGKNEKGEESITVQELMPMIEAIYKDNYSLISQPREIGPDGNLYPADEAIEATLVAVKGFQDELQEVLNQAKDGKIILLSVQERENKIKELAAAGKKLSEIVVEVKSEEGDKE